MSDEEQLPTLRDLVTKKIIPDDPVLLGILHEASLREDAFFFAGHLVRRNVDYISPSVERILGYPASAFVKGGAEFIFSLTDASSIPAIIQTEMSFIQRTKQPGFDPCIIEFQSFNAVMRTGFGFSLNIICLGVVMTYSELADMENGFAFQAIDTPDTVEWCKKMLTKLKARHNEVYRHPPFITNKSEKKDDEKPAKPLTAREEEILKLVAKGLTSKQIAKSLVIEENTVETHRKNILLKFEAKNVADLISKASKIYWLD